MNSTRNMVNLSVIISSQSGCSCLTKGDIVHIRVLGTSIIVIESLDILLEYLDKQAAKTSDRPQSVITEL